LRVYRGIKAYRLFLQAYQHILWKQCRSLIREKGFPAELWTVVRDLWSLRLSKLLLKLEDPLDGTGTESQGVPSGVDNQDQSDGQTSSAKRKLATGSPTLLDTICLCYMAILLLRVPTSLCQILRWIHQEDVPYIRAIRHVPAEMKGKLPGEYHEALDTSTVLRPEALQLGVSNLCTMYDRSYGLSIAPLNWPPMLYQYIERLSLPLEVYPVAKQLNDIVAFDFMFTNSGERRRKAISYPEAQLMCLVVVATKLLFPFNSNAVKRNPREASEPAILSIDWSAWVDGREGRSAAEKVNDSLQNGMEINVKDKDIFDMSSQQLDQYMDWYQRTWVKLDTADDEVNKELLDMFPLKEIAGKSVDRGSALREDEAAFELIKHMHANLKMNQIITDEQAEEIEGEVIRPGMQYQQFRDLENLSLSRVARLFYREAAELSCLSIDSLLRAVLQSERKITLWRRAKRRAETFGEAMDLEAEEALPLGLEGLGQMTLAEAAVDEAGLSDSDNSDSNMKMNE
jgi:RNA polymerase I-specific transcription initiation factor RRN7